MTFLAAVWSWVMWIVNKLGLAGTALALTLIYFLGLPWVNSIPYIGHIPFLGNIAIGYVEQERREAADEATKDMVSAATLATSEARAEKLEREAALAKKAAQEARVQRDMASEVAANALAELERRVRDDQDPDDSVWTEHDLERMHQ